jgi:hypothetical protein
MALTGVEAAAQAKEHELENEVRLIPTIGKTLSLLTNLYVAVGK